MGTSSDTISLPNGQKVPVACPPNLDPAIAKQVIEYLKANPEAAQQSYEQAHRMLQAPGMAQMVLEAKQNSSQRSPEQMAKMMQLKEDPELKPIFDDIEANGAAAMEKYWNDTELMSKISQKMSSMNLGPATPPRKQDNLKGLPSTLHDAAKVGDEASLKRLIEEGANVNEKDGRGISPLGVAVGFNRISCVKALLAAGADVHQTDARGSTVLHYAAGYGRKEAAQLLLAAGAKTDAQNADGQTPSAVAELNKELHMVAFLADHASTTGKEQEVFL
ncbi:Ankyrin repeat domain-containing protein 2A [Coccomyxa sp. Obi]|nr:Ankyrin repeat domain-containing protein 2A [Coccomyxa sp. Obi]